MQARNVLPAHLSLLARLNGGNAKLSAETVGFGRLSTAAANNEFLTSAVSSPLPRARKSQLRPPYFAEFGRFVSFMGRTIKKARKAKPKKSKKVPYLIDSDRIIAGALIAAVSCFS